jgi:hypothetical protein
MSVQTTVEKELESLRNSVKREASIKSNIFDCEAVVTHIQCMQDDSTPLPEGCPHESYEAWKETVEKEKKGYESQLLTIAKNKDLITAYEKYLEDNPAV